MTDLEQLRDTIRRATLRPDAEILSQLMARAPITAAKRARASRDAAAMIRCIRNDSAPGLMEVFLAEYGLSTDEGVALMCLAEALLRVPDAATMDALIEDKIAPSSWGAHLGQSSSSLVNASTWALMLTGKVLQDGSGIAATLHNAIRRVGEPVIRTAVQRAMKELGAQFVLGETIEAAIGNGQPARDKGYTYSYDMLGEAAMTAPDAAAFLDAYADAIARLAPRCTSEDIRNNPGISIKLSALHPRYETAQRDRVMTELVPRVLHLAMAAKSAGMGLNIDAEEADRLDLSLDVIEAVLSDPALAGWDGFGVVVQAYGKRALPVIDWLHALAVTHDRRIMLRLVKGAYWDTEIKHAQVEGLDGFPVFAQKPATDVSYICCAAHLLRLTDRIYPQFATHNAHSVATILMLADTGARFEFQRLHGMGDALHDLVLARHGARCRIYAPVGAHRDLLAYLVRRLLENGANSSFVNQIVDEDVPPEIIAADPFLMMETGLPQLRKPAALFAPERLNSQGWNLQDPTGIAALDAARAPFQDRQWQTGRGGTPILNPANPDDRVGSVEMLDADAAKAAIAAARPWNAPATDRQAALNHAADLYEAHAGEIFACLTREAGKTQTDAVAELREAVDFLRYYANGAAALRHPARGVVTCISPWNFPLAIFTGQIAAALAAGNGVLAKPAESTPLIAGIATRLLHQAGVPATALTLVPGAGAKVGTALTSDPRIDAVAFTGSTATAQRINRTMAAHLHPGAPLIAETGGINAMIVDSTALPEQAIRDILMSAFRSAGQRCSALRVLYVQADIADGFRDMLFAAIDEMSLGDPWQIATDIGPIIDAPAATAIRAHIDRARSQGRVIKETAAPATGHFIPPTVIHVDGIADVTTEIFGPVLHLATFEADEIDAVVDAINATGFGLTFGLHSRIDDRVEQITSRLNVGNIYVNRNQIGAVVGSQPFGGEGLSGTGPKAGGPLYLNRFTRAPRPMIPSAPPATADAATTIDAVQALIDSRTENRRAIDTRDLPGPTGESNRWTRYARRPVLCLGPGMAAALEQYRLITAIGGAAIMIAADLPDSIGTAPVIRKTLLPDALTALTGFSGVAFWGPEDQAGNLRRALAARDGAILPLLTETDLADRATLERHVCIDTTAAGGNAALLAATG